MHCLPVSVWTPKHAVESATYVGNFGVTKYAMLIKFAKAWSSALASTALVHAVPKWRSA